MTISPIEAAGYAWGVWLASWLLAALWNSRAERRSRSQADIVYRLLTGLGALLLFDLRIIVVGPYRLVRHPIYSGLLLSVISTAVLRGGAGAVLGATAIALGLFVKARVEERFLRSELGTDRYDGYARRVPMLVPFTR
jgi:protein-S-isoprenylcysteine O-methyltransferase Ste14